MKVKPACIQTALCLLLLFTQKTHQKGSLLTSCDFEKDFCDFVQDRTDTSHPLSSQTGTYDWERRDRPTLTDDTGPSGAQQGSGYAVVDASHPMKLGDSVRLLSPVLRYRGEVCVTFWYHMYGRHTGELRLYRQTALNSQQRQDSFRIKGNQGERWYRKEQTLMLGTVEDRIGFSATRGDGYEGDIALDNVIVHAGNCEDSGTTNTTDGTSSLSLPFTCGFESDWCGLSQSLDDSFNWTRQSGETGTRDTGPGGASEGEFYVYAEASHPRKQGEIAILSTPAVPHTGTYCIKFQYHMFDKSQSHMGTFKMYSSRTGPGEPGFQRTGDQGSKWLKAEVQLTTQSSDERIIFAATVGSGMHSDIALDELEVTEGKCTETEKEGSELVRLPFQCSFEEDLCGMQHEWPGASFNWSRHEGSTQTTETGPSKAYSGKYYIYTEASHPRREGDTASISTPAFEYTGPVCIEFFYHIHDTSTRSMGSLHVYSSRASSQISLFNETEGQGDRWIKGQLEYNLQKGDKILFSGTRGPGIQSDIALDSINIEKGTCKDSSFGSGMGSLPYSCSFESGFCGMTQHIDEDFDWTRYTGSTPSLQTGPDKAFSGSYYIYLEVSEVGAAQTSSISTPKFKQQGRICVRFHYHMFGEDIGSLSVYKEQQGSEEFTLLVTELGEKGDAWNIAQVETSIKPGEQIRFSGTTTAGFYGDIALDLIEITQGTCENSEEPATTTQPPSNLPLLCDFEEDLCGLAQTSSGQLDWIRYSGRTQSQNTGPELAQSGDYYIYVEMSSQSGERRKKPGDKASLETPALFYHGEVCVDFHYHALGSSLGSFAVYRESQGENSPEFEVTEEQGTEWKHVQFEVSVAHGEKLYFTAVRGSSVYGDIALDDLSITSGPCDNRDTKTPSTGNILPFTCDLEEDFCDLHQDSTDQFDWTRHTGNTRSDSTGPDEAFSGSYYMYAEASGIQAGAIASIATPSFLYEGWVCISFHYHMHGAGMGSLKVYKGENRKSETEPLFEKSGNQPNEWIFAEMETNVTPKDKIHFVGERGSSLKSDIAIDKIHIYKGPCHKAASLPFQCSFERDMCGMTFSTGSQGNWTRHSGMTTTTNTGPQSAEAGSYYVYTEASNSKEGDRFILESPGLDAGETETVCIVFQYHMFGEGMGTLALYRTHSHSEEVTSPLFETSGNHGDRWIQANVQIKWINDQKVLFIGTRGKGIQSDIALDELSITEGECTEDTSSGKGILPISCDFESGFCDLEQNSGYQLNWTRQVGATPSQDTGPREAQSGEFYVYLEATGESEGDQAYLETPSITESGVVCVQLYYHMYGSDMGSLKLYKGVQERENLIAERTGNQANKWEKLEVETRLDKNEKVMIIGERGNGFRGDVAVDNFQLKQGKCNEEEEITVEQLVQCGFEEPERFCELAQSTADEMDWSLMTGSTRSSDTGPSGAKTGRSYIYTEVSGKQEGDRACLETEVFEQSGQICISFYYHMYGSDIGTLKVMEVIEQEEEVIMELSGNQGNQWKKAKISHALQDGAKVVFEAVRGSGFKGDISLDDIRITTGSCDNREGRTKSVPLPIGCDFEQDLCDFRQETEYQYNWMRREGDNSVELSGPNQASSGAYYILAEAKERQEGDKAVLKTPALQYNGTVCVGLDYHMFDVTGEDMGYLTVYRRNVQHSNLGSSPQSELQGQTVQIFKQSGSQGNTWNSELIETDIDDGDQIILVAERGAGQNSDIALDNINITSGPCEALTQPTEGQATLPYTCTFEMGMCNLRQKYNDDFDWMRRNTPTETRGTGPDEAQQGDYYLYAESSIPRKEGHKAVIETPEMLHSGMACISFWYQMYDEGSDEMGELRLHLNKRSDNSPVFEVYGDQGYRWTSVRFNQPIRHREQLVFIATRGPGIRSDIAIDDIKILPFSCEEADSMSTKRPPSKPEDKVFSIMSCDIEGSGLESTTCRLRQDTSDQLQWKQGQGHTPSGYMLKKSDGFHQPATGPKFAHQGDYYAYIEASFTDPGQTAKLLLEGSWSQENGYNCLRFFYIMNGFHIGSLTVYSKRHGVYYTLWMMNGHQSSEWSQAVVEVNTKDITEVGFVGTTGEGFSGDIALDDVRITPGKCQSSSSEYLFQCTFEMADNVPTLCGMEQETTDTPHFDWMLWSKNTPSDDTGPVSAHSGQYYIYAEASQPRQQGDQARILLPHLKFEGPVCVEFCYFMHGYHMGALEVYTQDTEVEKRTSHMTIKGPRGEEWLIERITLEEIDDGQQIGFRAIRGAEFSADIALDNVKVTRGEC